MRCTAAIPRKCWSAGPKRPIGRAGCIDSGVVGELRINWKDLIAFKRTFTTDPVPKKREESFAKQDIDAFHGVARFGGPDAVIVEGRALKGRQDRCIAAGAYAGPARLSRCGARHYQRCIHGA